MVLLGLVYEQGLEFGEPLRVFGRQIVDKTEVAARVVQLPNVLDERPPRLGFPGRPVDGPGQPAIVVDGSIAEHFEVLRHVTILLSGLVERVHHAHAIYRTLRRTVDHSRFRKAGCIENSRRDIDHMAELRTQFALWLDALGPTNRHADLGTAEV